MHVAPTDFYVALDALSEVVDGGDQRSPSYRVEYFNDQKETSFDDVVDAFDRAIKNLEME